MFLNDSKELYNTYTYNRIWKDRSICQIVNGIYNFRLRIRFLFEKQKLFFELVPTPTCIWNWKIISVEKKWHIKTYVSNYVYSFILSSNVVILPRKQSYSLISVRNIGRIDIIYFFMKLKINDENIPINFNIILKINPKYYGYILIWEVNVKDTTCHKKCNLIFLQNSIDLKCLESDKNIRGGFCF